MVTRPKPKCRVCRKLASVRLIIRDERGKPMTIQALCADDAKRRVGASPHPDRLTLVTITEAPA